MKDELTEDAFFNGRIRIKQNRFGYRFSVDAVLLAFYARPRPKDTVIDLGTGCGIIPLILAYRNPETKVYGIEAQQDLADISAINIEENRMGKQISIFCMDMKILTNDIIPGPIDIAISNPPYRKVKSGRINPDRQKAMARHEIKATLFDVVETAKRMLRVSGRFVVIYPAERLIDIVTQMRASGIEPKFTRMIHSFANKEAKMVLLEGIKGGRPGIKVDPPLIIYRDGGSYTDEVEKMFLP